MLKKHTRVGSVRSKKHLPWFEQKWALLFSVQQGRHMPEFDQASQKMRENGPCIQNQRPTEGVGDGGRPVPTKGYFFRNNTLLSYYFMKRFWRHHILHLKGRARRKTHFLIKISKKLPKRNFWPVFACNANLLLEIVLEYFGSARKINRHSVSSITNRFYCGFSTSLTKIEKQSILIK